MRPAVVGDVLAVARRARWLQHRGPAGAGCGVEAIEPVRRRGEQRGAVLRQAEDQRTVELGPADLVPGRATVGGSDDADAGVAVRTGIGLARAGVDRVMTA